MGSRTWSPQSTLSLVFFSAPTSRSTTASRDYLSLAPLLQQTFFIGNGRTSSNQVQQVIAPAGATRLFLGTMDGYGWFNNTGSLTVVVNSTFSEPPLPGWTIQLDAGVNGTVDQSQVTDGNGNYSFTGLDRGTYRVREVQQSGWTQTSPNPSDLTVASSSQTFLNVDFGNTNVSSACLTQTSGQVARWPADGNADDTAGIHDGTLINGALATAPGVLGQAFSLDGSDDEIEISSFNGLSVTDFSLNTWVYIDPATNSGERRVFSWDDYPTGGSDGQREAIVI
jgi:hypothetical protein